jgi:hypothetical protein
MAAAVKSVASASAPVADVSMRRRLAERRSMRQFNPEAFHAETQRGIAATKASFRSRVPLPASFCGERETRSAGEGRFPMLDLPSAAPSSAFGTFSPAQTAGEKDSRCNERREPSKKNLRGAQNLWVSSTENTEVAFNADRQ